MTMDLSKREQAQTDVESIRATQPKAWVKPAVSRIEIETETHGSIPPVAGDTLHITS